MRNVQEVGGDGEVCCGSGFSRNYLIGQTKHSAAEAAPAGYLVTRPAMGTWHTSRTCGGWLWKNL